MYFTESYHSYFLQVHMALTAFSVSCDKGQDRRQHFLKITFPVEVCRGLMSHWTHYRLFRGRFLQVHMALTAFTVSCYKGQDRRQHFLKITFPVEV